MVGGGRGGGSLVASFDGERRSQETARRGDGSCAEMLTSKATSSPTCKSVGDAQSHRRGARHCR